MFGIEINEILLFALQLGLSASGAAALWGLVLTHRGKSEHHGDECIIFDWIAEKLLFILYGGIVLAGSAWFILTALVPASAHVGVTLVPTAEEHAHALMLMWPIFALWLLASPIGLFVRQFKPEKFHHRLKFFFSVQLLFAVVLISVPAWSGEFGLRQFFFFSHSAHSILTLGTVIVLDFLFLISKSSLHLKQHVYPLFPLISKVILAGLALEFIGVLAVFNEALVVTPKFLFMETVIGILLINGMILAGPLTRRMINAIEHSNGALADRWEVIGDIAGTISITSWFTITFVDYFQNLTLSYLGMFSIYVSVLIVAIAVHLFWRSFLNISIPRGYFAWHRGS